MASALSRLFRTKSLAELERDHLGGTTQALKRALGPWHVTSVGIGAIIGAGIFLTVGVAASGDANHAGAGPAVILSFVLSAITCGFAALCYAELASMIPISGSAYTYVFATMGELIAWIIGWDLLIEYAIGNVAVAISWGDYFQHLLGTYGWHLPSWLSMGYRSALGMPDGGKAVLDAAPHLLGIPIVADISAAAIVLLITWVLVVGIRESSSLNVAMVILKLAILGFFVAIGLSYFDSANWVPFAPNGLAGIKAGAAVVFFAYIGFDAVSTVAEETRNPGRDMPIGIIGSLVICTIVYIVVAAVLTGMVPSASLDPAAPLSVALEQKGAANWIIRVISFGSVIAHTAVLLVFQMGQPRIFFAMSRDGLLPAAFAKVHPKYRTPHVTTILTGLVVAALAAFFHVEEIVNLTNIGTLFAFVLVCSGVLILRVKEPHRERKFRCPLVWLMAPLGILSCIYLMTGLDWITWVRFGLWLAVGLALYFVFVVLGPQLFGFRRRQEMARASAGGSN